MKKDNFNKRFTVVVIGTSLFCATGIGVITNTMVNDVPEMIEEIKVMDVRNIAMYPDNITTEATTATTTTETTTTTEMTTTTTTTEITVTTEEAIETIENVEIEQALTYEETESIYYDPYIYYGVTKTDLIMLANVVGGEYGSDWVPIYDKACVVATIMNRYYDGGWQGCNYDGSLRENTIYNIITAPGQYDPYYANYTYNWNVTQSCIDAVDYYFNNQELFPHITSFYGDGTYNYFS